MSDLTYCVSGQFWDLKASPLLLDGTTAIWLKIFFVISLDAYGQKTAGPDYIQAV